MRQLSPYLRHIIDETEYIIQNSCGFTYNDFINNETLKRSFVRSLEIIGEAVKNLPDDFRRKYPQIEWKKLAGLRDVLIHQYFGINYELVWDIVKNKVPELKNKVESIIEEIEK